MRMVISGTDQGRMRSGRKGAIAQTPPQTGAQFTDFPTQADSLKIGEANRAMFPSRQGAFAHKRQPGRKGHGPGIFMHETKADRGRVQRTT